MNPNEDKGELGGFPHRDSDKHTKSVFKGDTKQPVKVEDAHETEAEEIADEAPINLEEATEEVAPETEIENTDPVETKIEGEGDEF